MFSKNKTHLKICGVTTPDDAAALADLGVTALGANFFPGSKRFLPPESAESVLAPVAGKILRVGVFVNSPAALPLRLFTDGLIDAVQLHGDETPADVALFLEKNIPVIKAISASLDAIIQAPEYQANAILLDTPAGKDYGGTGKTFDWTLAAQFREKHPDRPLLLAGGLTPDNASEAIQNVQPNGIDIASGAELVPGIKDLDKVKRLLEILKRD